MSWKKILEEVEKWVRLIIGVIIGVPLLVMATIICMIGELIERRLRKKMNAYAIKVNKSPEELIKEGRCPNCGYILIRQEGCLYCPICGWSSCSG